MSEDLTTPAAVSLRPIGAVVGGRDEPVDDDWESEQAIIRLDEAQFTEQALAGLEEFSHLEVVFLFHLVDPATVQTAARRPRGNPDWPLVGIFAQRGKNRPNRLAVSRCRLVRVDGLSLYVEGLDAIAGTPVLDIKPYMAEFGPRGEVVQPTWATELMQGYY